MKKPNENWSAFTPDHTTERILADGQAIYIVEKGSNILVPPLESDYEELGSETRHTYRGIAVSSDRLIIKVFTLNSHIIRSRALRQASYEPRPENVYTVFELYDILAMVGILRARHEQKNHPQLPLIFDKMLARPENNQIVTSYLLEDILRRSEQSTDVREAA